MTPENSAITDQPHEELQQQVDKIFAGQHDLMVPPHESAVYLSGATNAIQDIIDNLDGNNGAPERLLGVDECIAHLIQHSLLSQDEQAPLLEQLQQTLQYSKEPTDSYFDKDKVPYDFAVTLLEKAAVNGVALEGFMNIYTGFPAPAVAMHAASSEHPEIYERAEPLILMLMKHPDLNILESQTINEIMRKPDHYAPSVKIINDRFSDLKEAGYSSSYIGDVVSEIFSVYAVNNQACWSGRTVKDGNSADVNFLSSSFDAMQLLRGCELPLNDLLHSNEIIGNVAMDIYWDKPINEELLRQNIEDVTQKLSAMKDQDEPLFELISKMMPHERKLDISFKNTKNYLEIGRQIKQHDSLFATLKNQGAAYDTARHVAVNQLGSKARFNPESNRDQPTPPEAYEILDICEKTINVQPGLQGWQIFESMLGDIDIDQAHAFYELVSSADFKSVLDDPSTGLEVSNNSAIDLMYRYAGKFDIKRAAGTFKSIDRPSGNMLTQIAAVEARLRIGHLQEAVDRFYALAPNELSRRDKDDNSYSSVELIEAAILTAFNPLDSRVEVLDWFLSGDLPIAAFGPISHIHQEAVTSLGDTATPQDVYRWFFDRPEKVDEISHQYLEKYLKMELPIGGEGRADRLHAVDEKIIEKIIPELREMAQDRKDSYRIMVNVGEEALATIVGNGGTLKSMLDTNVDVARGDSYARQRSGVEIALGIRSLDEISDHPVYGTAIFIDGGLPKETAVAYGEIALTFKETPDLESRTTYTPEDSFHGAYRLTSEDAKILRLAKSALGVGFSNTAGYVEAQVRGGLSLDQVDTIYVTGSQEKYESVKAILPENLRDRVVLVPETMDYDNSREASRLRSITTLVEASKKEEEDKILRDFLVGISSKPALQSSKDEYTGV